MRCAFWDENFPSAGLRVLRDAGHDVLSLRAVAPGSNDSDVLALTAQQGRILLTFDKDFGELARKAASPPLCGVVLFRIPMPRPGDVGSRIANLITERDDWEGHFSVIEPGRIRMRPLS